MSDTWLLLLKYTSWILTVGTAFVGTWFFEFTTTDKGTGKRSLTPWGRRGIIFALLSLVCAFAATVWSDKVAADKQQKADQDAQIAQKKALAEQQEARKYQQQFESRQQDTLKLVQLINENINKFSPEDQQQIAQIVRPIISAEDFKESYPELYERAINATSFDEFRNPVEEALRENVAKRVSGATDCKNIELNKWPGTIWTGSIRFGDNSQSYISYYVEPNYVRISMNDDSATVDLSDGYHFLFADGRESAALTCKKFKNPLGCDDTTDDENTREVFKSLQTNNVSKVISKDKVYSVPEEVSEKLRRTLACIEP